MASEEINTDDGGNKNEKCDCITILYIMFVIIATVAVIIMVASINNLGDTPKVMGLVGILAAFVVISNYAQMVEVRNQTDKRIKELEEKLENMNTNMEGMTKTIETDRDKIYAKFSGVEKMMYVDQGVFYRYYVIYQQDKYKMVEIRGKDAFELSFKKFLSRYDDESVKDMFRRMLKDFGVPLDKD
jgi:hypothetical protein